MELPVPVGTHEILEVVRVVAKDSVCRTVVSVPNISPRRAAGRRGSRLGGRRLRARLELPVLVGAHEILEVIRVVAKDAVRRAPRADPDLEPGRALGRRRRGGTRTWLGSGNAVPDAVLANEVHARRGILAELSLAVA